MWSGQQGLPCPANPCRGWEALVIVSSCWFGHVASAQPFRPSVYSRPYAAEASCVSGAVSSVFTPTVCPEIFPKQCSHLSPSECGDSVSSCGTNDQQACSEHA